MKVIHILTDTNIGGAGRHLLAILEFYDRTAFDIEVVLPVGSRLTPLAAALDVPVWEVPHIQDRSFSVKGFFALYQLLKGKKADKADIVHTHASLSGRLAAKIHGISVIHTRHYCVTKSVARGSVLNLGSVFSDKIIAVSPEITDTLTASGTKPENIATIYNGVPPLKELSYEEKSAVRTRYGISGSAFVVSQIGRLDPIKGCDHMLDAAKLLSHDEEIVLLLAGDGPIKEHLHSRIKQESINNVLMTGFVADIEEIFAITDLQINSSYTEATCLSLLEGMSLGIPAVATNVGGNPYVIVAGKSGLIVPYGDPDAIARGVLEIKNDENLYKKLSAGAVDEYNKRFRVEDMVGQIEDVYRAI